MSEYRPWYRPPRPPWAEQSQQEQQPAPVQPTKRQRKRAREKAKKRARREAARNIDEDPAALEAAEAEARARVAAALEAIRITRAAQHREAIERHYRGRADRRRYDADDGPVKDRARRRADP